jgi:hypothetical protein
MNAENKALEIYNSHYASIMEYGGDFGQEILVSVLAIKASIITIEQKTETAIQVGGYVEAKIYVNFMGDVKKEIEKL